MKTRCVNFVRIYPDRPYSDDEKSHRNGQISRSIHISLGLYTCPPATVSLGSNKDEELIKDAFVYLLLQLLPSQKETICLMGVNMFLCAGTHVFICVYMCIQPWRKLEILLYTEFSNSSFSDRGGNDYRLKWLSEVRTFHYIICLPIAIFRGGGGGEKNHCLTEAILAEIVSYWPTDTISQENIADKNCLAIHVPLSPLAQQKHVFLYLISSKSLTKMFERNMWVTVLNKQRVFLSEPIYWRYL